LDGEKARVGIVKAVSILAFSVNQDLNRPQRCFRNPEADGISHQHRHNWDNAFGEMITL